ncbi:MAG: 5-formyltetrahydrofolate cyclo-ligase [Eggerthellaceae bacterium]|jgi:5-formyltetrahydrofolate cyclo-ligase
MAITDEKKALRQQVLARRDAIASDQREGKNVLICAQLAREVDWDELAEKKEMRQWAEGAPVQTEQQPPAQSGNPLAADFSLLENLLEEDRGPALNVAVYASMGSEPDITGFVAMAYMHHAHVCYPCMERIPAAEQDGTRKLRMTFRKVSFDQRATCPFVVNPLKGLDADDPVLADYPRIAPADLDIIVTPLVAFDEQGNRLGYGGGNYDRLFAETRQDAFIVGIAYAEQRVDAVPCEDFDKPLPRIVSA